MKGQMMQQPLLISSLLRHAEACHGDTQIVSRRVEPAQGEARFHRTDWSALAPRARRLANALKRLGIAPGDRVGTLAWNGYRHLELYYAVSGSGAVIHTVNPRLFPEQIAWIVNHAEDQVVCFDIDLAPLVEKLAPQCPGVKAWIAMSDSAHCAALQGIPALLCYEELLAAGSAQFEWPLFDEGEAACLCYTSGTTGNPKGVLYSHKALVLQALAIALPDVMCASALDVALPIVPMFHVNAWAMPYVATLVGCKLVLPGPALDGASLSELILQEEVTLSAGVPTVWLNLLQYVTQHGIRFPSLKRCFSGGAALPRALFDNFEAALGIKLRPSWGMTEMSPLGAVNTPKRKHLDLPEEARRELELKAGRVPFGVSAKIVDANGQELPRDGRSSGDLLVRGPWIIDRYFKGEAPASVDGWFATGDVATLDGDGFITITDRSKDLIKSGGEWISSIELEGIAMSHPAVLEAAVIAATHPKWDERPLVIAVLRPGAAVTREALLGHYQGRIPKWWTPDDVVFVEQLPRTATGKVHKLRLREAHSAHLLKPAS